MFQIRRASDNATQDIGALPYGGVNQAAINLFCAATTCAYSLIYDQMHTAASGNNLPQATAANQAPVTYTTFANGMTLPMVATLPGQFYRNRAATVGIPTGNASITEYDVINTFTYSPCCGTYGNMESTVADTGSGHMFALGFGTGGPQAGTGGGPWPAIDYENGFYTYGATPTATLLTEIAKYNSGSNLWAIKSDPGLTGTLTLETSNTPPATAAFEGGISWGEGGDATPAPTAGFEAVIIASATTDATDNAIAENVAAFYKGAPSQPAPTPVTNLSAKSCSSSPCSNTVIAVPAGSLIVVVSYEASATPSADVITDTRGNIYTLAARQCLGFVNGNAACLGPSGTGFYSVFYSYNVAALSAGDTITMTNATATPFLVFEAVYATGFGASDPLDNATIATNFGTSGAQSVTSGTPTQTGELFVALDNDGVSGGSDIPQGWTRSFGNLFRNNWGNAGTLRNPANVPLAWSDGTATSGFAAMIVGFKTH